MPLHNDIQNNVSEFNYLHYKNIMFKKNYLHAHDGAYFVIFVDNSELLDFGSHYQITWYLRIGKNNTLNIFMFSGSIQFSFLFRFNAIHAFSKIMPYYNFHNQGNTILIQFMHFLK